MSRYVGTVKYGPWGNAERTEELEEIKVTEEPGNRCYTGYGGKITTGYMVRLKGSKRWLRVYMACYSNSGTCYVCVKGEELVVDIWLAGE